MSTLIDKKTLEYLAELGRIKLADSEEVKLLKDLQEILNYFQELQKIDITDVEPMVGAPGAKNVFREDAAKKNKTIKKLIENFPEKENSFLKIPPVFE
jgi:aspartyl-tRNA(Asn)/glutamyl-tRNA(Gln) amidotransferase subunit C